MSDSMYMLDRITGLLDSGDFNNIVLAFQLMKGQDYSYKEMAKIWRKYPYSVSVDGPVYFLPPYLVASFVPFNRVVMDMSLDAPYRLVVPRFKVYLFDVKGAESGELRAAFLYDVLSSHANFEGYLLKLIKRYFENEE